MNGNIKAKYINVEILNATGDINAHNIDTTFDITANNITAWNVCAYNICAKNIDVNSIKAHETNAINVIEHNKK